MIFMLTQFHLTGFNLLTIIKNTKGILLYLFDANKPSVLKKYEHALYKYNVGRSAADQARRKKMPSKWSNKNVI